MPGPGPASDPGPGSGTGEVGRSPRSERSAPSAFPPIASYAFISDCEVNALVAPSGNIEWMCAPRPDSPSIFGAILDRSAGGFRVGPTDRLVPAGRRYLPGSMVVETTWQTSDGWLVVRDALLVGRWRHRQERSAVYARVPTDYQAESVLVRTMDCISGTAVISVDCEPVLDYGRRPLTWSYAGDDYGSVVGRAEGLAETIALTSDLRFGFEGRRARARVAMRAGDRAFVALTWSGAPAPASWEEADEAVNRTADFWRRWLGHGSFTDHEWAPILQRSALTLKGLSYAPTGALLAAATTSLPETPGGERNWDYRYSWIRDSTFMLWGLYTLGFDWEANDFFCFLADVAGAGADLQVMYGVGGEPELEEEVLDHLSGYDGARPVRIGNGAFSQRQHDVWGAVLDSAWLHAKSRDHMRESVWPLLIRQVESALDHWRQPDRGIWEVRGEPRHFTSSKLMCWVAAERGARLASLHGEAERAEGWHKAAAEIAADICEHGVDSRGVFVQHYGTTALDASLLLLPLVRFLPAGDPRVRATVLAVADELTVDGLVLRYRVDQTDDGLRGEEGTFAICSFWLVSALSEIGEHDRARALCEKLLALASPLGLYAEEIDPTSGRHLGNFPQAFTHLALINAVMHVIRSDAAGPGRDR
ncbi:MAG: glycoside hydrolase family 15 protein [Acidimicrobiales bacterium]